MFGRPRFSVHADTDLYPGNARVAIVAGRQSSHEVPVSVLVSRVPIFGDAVVAAKDVRFWMLLVDPSGGYVAAATASFIRIDRKADGFSFGGFRGNPIVDEVPTEKVRFRFDFVPVEIHVAADNRVAVRV